MAHLIVFTDLDGTLLDHASYSWEAARPALRQLRLRRVPVVLCTSKTRAEVMPLWEELGLKDPFVVENGGAAYIPRNYFPFPLPQAREGAQFQVLELGESYQKLVRALDEAAKTGGIQVRGFSRMTDKEVAKLCDLKVAAARLARRREFDEPFVIEKATPERKERFFNWLRERGLRCRQGGRFLHLMGDNDKGVAVQRLIDFFRQSYSGIRTVGLGDSPNDLDFLQVVDEPVLVAKPDGSHDAEVRSKLPQARLANGAGPEGWNEAIENSLSQGA